MGHSNSTLFRANKFETGKRLKIRKSVDYGGGKQITLSNGSVVYIYNRPMAMPTVDLVPYEQSTDSLILIIRGNSPFKDKLAFMGGKVEIKDNESIDDAFVREAKEEMGIDVNIKDIVKVTTVGNATRDPRFYTVSCVGCCVVNDFKYAKAGDDARALVRIKFTDIMGALNGSLSEFTGYVIEQGSTETCARKFNLDSFSFDHKKTTGVRCFSSNKQRTCQ